MFLKWDKKVACAQKPLSGCKDWLVQPYKTERDHLNIEKLTALFDVMPIHHLIYGYVNCDTNILKMHMCANIKKIGAKKVLNYSKRLKHARISDSPLLFGTKLLRTDISV